MVVAGTTAWALPQGYLVWTHGTAEDPASRKLHRLTLPEKTDLQVLTAGEDVEPQISPDGKWVAYAKAKFAGGSDYHDFKLWKVYLVSIHGAADRRREIKIDDDGAWPSWGSNGALFYNQADGTHSRIMRVEIDERGQVTRRQTVLSTSQAFGGFVEINEGAVAPDETWFAARTRGNAAQNGVAAFTFNPAAALPLARAGDVGCMPRVAPSGTFALIAGAGEGIRWGHGPQVAGRQVDQVLIPPRSPQHLAYHPAISTDGRWVLAAQSTEPNHNSGRYDLSIYALDPATMTVSDEQGLTSADFNGWPHLWVGAPSVPPPPRPEIGGFRASRYTVAPGETVTLSWTTFGADEVLLNGTAVAPEGTQDLVASMTSQHTLVVRNPTGANSDMRSLQVVVNPTPQPVAIDQLLAEPARIERGRSTTLRWSVRNATTLELDGESVAPTGTREVSPLDSTSYVLIAQGQGGPVQAAATVTVEAQKTGLLPDRGGFRCSAAGPGAWVGQDWQTGRWGWLLVLLALGGRRRRRSKQRGRQAEPDRDTLEAVARQPGAGRG